MIGGIIPAKLAEYPSSRSTPRPATPCPVTSAASRAGRTLPRRPTLALPTAPWNSLAPSGSPAPQHLPLERPASPGLRCGPQQGTRLPGVVSRSRDIRLSATGCARHARPIQRAADAEPPGRRARAAPATNGHRTPIQLQLCPVTGEHRPAAAAENASLLTVPGPCVVTVSQTTHRPRRQPDTSSQNSRTG
jgi:hypothetical protein